MKKIIYYITDHGKGHATRSVAIIRELKKLNINIIIRNSNSVELLQQCLPGMSVIDEKTDVGPVIKDDGISIDTESSKLKLHQWIQDLDNSSERELIHLKKTDPDLIISDISVMPIKAAKKADVSSIVISNFSWYDVLKFLEKTDLEILIQEYYSSQIALQLPLGTDMNHFKQKIKTGFASRYSINSREIVRKKLGLTNSDILVAFALGGSNLEIETDFDKEIKIISLNSKIKNVENLVMHSPLMESQDLIAASDLVICKCGYGTVTECLTNGIPFYYIASDEHLEQKSIVSALRCYSSSRQITLEEINHLSLNKKQIQNLPKNQESIDNSNIANIIKEFLIN